MKRLLALLVLAVALFYIAWPAYSGYTIKTALDAKDADALRKCVDFESVRASMRPAISVKVETLLDAAADKAGPAAAKIYAALKSIHGAAFLSTYANAPIVVLYEVNNGQLF